MSETSEKMLVIGNWGILSHLAIYILLRPAPERSGAAPEQLLLLRSKVLTVTKLKNSFANDAEWIWKF